MRLATSACSNRGGGTAVARASTETDVAADPDAARWGKLFKTLPFAVNSGLSCAPETDSVALTKAVNVPYKPATAVPGLLTPAPRLSIHRRHAATAERDS